MEAWIVVANFVDYDLPVAAYESKCLARLAVRTIQRNRKVRFRLLKLASKAFQVRLPDLSPRCFSVTCITRTGCKGEEDDETS